MSEVLSFIARSTRPFVLVRFVHKIEHFAPVGHEIVKCLVTDFCDPDEKASDMVRFIIREKDPTDLYFTEVVSLKIAQEVCPGECFIQRLLVCRP
jgi:hypothetical protein